jgi:hypothetical protein
VLQLAQGFLDEPLELEDVTFERFFSLLLDESKFVNTVFASAMGGYTLMDYAEEFSYEPLTCSDIDKLVLSWVAGYSPAEGGSPAWGFEFYLDLSGASGEEGRMAIGFTPLYAYKKLPLVINPMVQIFNFKDSSTLECGEMQPTVYDVICAVLHEITFYGNPKERSSSFAQVVSDVESIKKELSNEDKNNTSTTEAS